MNSLRTLAWWHISRPWILTWCNPSLGSPQKCHRLRVICRNMKILKALVHLEITKKNWKGKSSQKIHLHDFKVQHLNFLRVLCLMNLFKNFPSCSGDLFYLVSFLSKETTLCIFAEKLQKTPQNMQWQQFALVDWGSSLPPACEWQLDRFVCSICGSLYRERLTK